MSALPLGLIIICAVVALAVIGVGGFLVLVKLGVIVREASKPAYLDSGNYSMDQGREVRSEEEQKHRR
jgi:hypothetical protein